MEFKKIHTRQDLAISIILIAAGTALFFINKGLGLTIGICGLFSALFYKKGYMKDGQKVLLQKSSEDLCKSCRTSILEYLNGQDRVPIIKKGNEGGSIRLDVYFNRKEGIAYAQLFDFHNYAYEPATEIIELHSPKADKLLSQIR